MQEKVPYQIERSRADDRPLTSPMEEDSGIDVFQFIRDSSEQRWYDYICSHGADPTLTAEYSPELVGRVNIDPQDVIGWILNHENSCQRKVYQARKYHLPSTAEEMDLPRTAGYHHKNTREFNWGLYGNSNEELKELITDWNTVRIQKDTALLRLLAYLPGNVLPYHMDTNNGWARENAHLNPNLETMTCDLGPIRRHLVMITDWHWGHILQIQHTIFPKWKSGEVYHIPAGVWHLSANAGVKLKLTMSITGAMI